MSLRLVPHHTSNIYVETEVQLHVFVSAPDGGKSSASRFYHFNPGKSASGSHSLMERLSPKADVHAVTKKNSCRKMNLDSPTACSLVTAPTELSIQEGRNMAVTVH